MCVYGYIYIYRERERERERKREREREREREQKAQQTYKSIFRILEKLFSQHCAFLDVVPVLKRAC